MEGVVLDPNIQDFTNNTANGKPIYTLTPQQARDTLINIQQVNVEIPPVKIYDYVIPINNGIPIKIVRAECKLDEKVPVIMYFHGGGWILGNFLTHYRLVSEIAFYTECAVIFVEYTPSPEAKYPITIQHAYAATKYISDNACQFGVDGERLAVMGDSVGGNMATVVALLAKDKGTPKISLQVLLYPVTNDNLETESYIKYANGPWLTKCAMEWYWKAYSPCEDDHKFVTVNPLSADICQLKGLPPALIITAENDVLRDEGEAYAHKLMKAGVPVLATRYIGAIHDFLMLNPIANSLVTRAALSQIFNFIKCTL
jgi:acetyl esterase